MASKGNMEIRAAANKTGAGSSAKPYRQGLPKLSKAAVIQILPA